MGTRAQVFIEDAGVYLYNHACDNPIFVIKAVLSAINRSEEWGGDDNEYLAATIFHEMTNRIIKIRPDTIGPSGIFGIGNELHGDLDIIVTINCRERTVKTERHPVHPDDKGEFDPFQEKRERHGVRQCSFDDFRDKGVKALRKLPMKL